LRSAAATARPFCGSAGFVMSYANDVFISYTRDDESWSQQLEYDLKARNPALKIFRDKTRLQPGDRWRDDLLKNLQESQHLVVLWSNKAKQSGWVNAELANFLAHARGALDRKLLCLVLEGDNPAYAVTQMLMELGQNNAYAANPQSLSDPLKSIWRNEIDRLDAVIRAKDTRIAIPWTAIVLTEAEIAKLSGTENIAGKVACSLSAVLGDMTSLGAGALGALQQYYGKNRFDWKPFLGTVSVKDMLDDLIKQINGITLPARGVEFKWEWVDFLTGNMQKTEAAVQRLSGECVLVVVDPISLYDNFIQNWISMLKPCFEQENVLLLTLPPFGLPHAHSSLRDLVKGGLAPFLDFYFNPPVPLNRTAPWCALNLGDAVEVRRLVQSKIGRHPRVGAVREQHPVISMGK
jgi:hypothetical protein